MADAYAAKPCREKDETAGWLPPPEPFVAMHYHFGMLLGVADLEAEQAYHRGKMRLHNAWLHGSGVVWGYTPSFDPPSGEIRVGPGLALDGAGRELLLDADACANVGVWFDDYVKSGKQPALDPNSFDVQLVARARTCFARPVPAIAEPCSGATRATAFSRIAERVELFLRPVPQTVGTAARSFHRVRLFLGLDEPKTDANGIVAADQEVLKELAGPAAYDPAARLAAFRRFAALDTLDLKPPVAKDGDPFPLFPESDSAVVVLALIKGVHLEKTAAGWKASVQEIDSTVRSTLLPTAAIQELLLGPVPPPAGGPRVVAAVLADNAKSIDLTTDKDLLQPTLTADSVLVSVIEPNGAGGWKPLATVGTLDATKKKLTVSVATPPAKGGLIRLVVRGTGPKPVLGTDLAPLAGPGSTSPTAHDGVDFVYTVRRN